MARLLGVDEAYLWPSTALDSRTVSAGRAELVEFYPSRSAVPVDLWRSLVVQAKESIDILVYAGLFFGPASSGARATPTDAAAPGRNRIHLIVDSLEDEISRLGGAGVPFRSDAVSGPGGRQILLADPAGNLIELFQPAR